MKTSSTDVKQELNAEEIQESLRELCRRHHTNERIIDWITFNVMPKQLTDAAFIRALFVSVCDALVCK